MTKTATRYKGSKIYSDRRIQAGDIVEYKGAFLRSCGWFTEVPKHGHVLELEKLGDSVLARISWCIGETSCRVVYCVNVENLAKRGTYDPN